MICSVKRKEIVSRLMWVKLRAGGEIWMFIRAYSLGSGKGGEIRFRFWESLTDYLVSTRMKR